LTKVHIIRIASLALVGLLVALPASAQVKFGALTAGMDGTLGVGYGASYAPDQPTGTGLGLTGFGNLQGNYYDPRFLTYAVSGAYNRSESNTQGAGGSLTNGSNIGAGVGLFTGSHFPASISWGKTFGTSGTYGLPGGVQGFVTDGDSTQFSAGWSAMLPNLPTLAASYNQISSTTSIFGTSQEDHSTSRNLNLQSNYRLDGWPMSAHLAEVFLTTQTPSFLSAGEANVGDEHATNLNFSTNHKLPLYGGVGLSYSYDSYSGGSGGTRDSGSGNSFSVNASFVPTRRFTTQFQFQYNGNLQSQVENQLIGAGSVAPRVNLGSNSHTLSFSNSDSFLILSNLGASCNFSRVQQEVYGTTIAEDTWSAVVNYHFQRALWGSVLLYAGANDLAENGANQGASLSAGANFSRLIKAWQFGGGFSYQQSVQTIVALVTTSNYSYNASVGRPLTRRLVWNADFHGFHSGFNQVAGLSNKTEGVGTNLLYRGFALAANYSESVGTSLITQNGLVAVPVGIPTPVLGANQYLQTSGKSYSVSASGTLRQLVLTTAYTNVNEATSSPSANSNNSSTVMFANASYPWRKMGFVAGYTHLTQGVGMSGGGPASFSSYYIGIQRWFKPF
jgi:hypothetical protein